MRSSAVQLDHVASAVDYGGALLASANVLLNGDAQAGFDFTVEIV